MYRLLATDIDDTILAPDGSLPETNRRALENLHRRGIAVVFSSGRATMSVRQVAGRIITLADDEYIISFNGARVVTARSGTVLFEQILPAEALRVVASYARDNNLLIQGYDSEEFIVEKEDPRCEEYSADTGMGYRVVESIADALPGGSAKLLIIDEHENLLGHQKKLESLSAGRWDVTFSKPHYLEIVSPGISKGEALRRLAEHLDVPIEDTLAVGDSLNDSAMLEAAGLGVAVANAREELKAIADVVLERTAEEGAIEELAERFFSEEHVSE
ncbi:MAG: Cof-type HAD-IIB family hydrolase [Spirochaetaceae bacterium]